MLKNITHTLTHINTFLSLSSAAISTAFGIYLFSSKCPDLISALSIVTNNHLFSQTFLKWHRCQNHIYHYAVPLTQDLGSALWAHSGYRLLLKPGSHYKTFWVGDAQGCPGYATLTVVGSVCVDTTTHTLPCLVCWHYKTRECSHYAGLSVRGHDQSSSTNTERSVYTT